MITYLNQVVNSLNKPKNYLLLVNVFLVFFLIALNNLHVIPLRTGDFVFFTILSLFLTLWRPNWAFLIFCGMIPLEGVNLAPASLGLAIRPYQFVGALIVLAILVRLASGRLNFKLAKFRLPDYAVLLITLGGFLSLVASPDKMASLKLEVICITFSILYFLVRNYVQNIEDLKKIVPFVLSSSIIVSLYGIWQNIIFLHGGNSFAMMPGRPNLTFTEADWAGGFIVLIIALIYTLLYYRHSESCFSGVKNLPINTTSDNKKQILAPPLKLKATRGRQASAFLRMTELTIYLLLTLAYVILILTVSRSAWLAALASFIIFIWIFFTNLKIKNWHWKETIRLKLKIFFSFALAVAIIFVFHLTNFQLGNRVQSTTSGLQKITVACEPSSIDFEKPMVIKDFSFWEKYGCRHINLEDIEKEKAQGNFIVEAYRHDPNVSVRAEIYQKSWAEIKNHPLSGIGWGSMGLILGQDGQGTTLNSSNIFLEVWLGAGVLGLLGLLGVLGYSLFTAIKTYSQAKSYSQKAVALFIITSWFGLIVFNLFNAGIFLGFFWVWLAIAQAEG